MKTNDTHLAALARARRAELSAQWPALTPSEKHLRRSGQLFAVWDEVTNSWRVPEWQYNSETLVNEMGQVLKILREGGCTTSDGWFEAQWFLSPHVLLASRPPSEVLAKEPHLVIEAAYTQFVVDRDHGF